MKSHFLLLSVAFLGLQLLTAAQKNSNKCDNNAKFKTRSARHGLTMDVAVVGGGASGLYSGYRILTGTKQKLPLPSQPSVHIFELSSRICGRLLSIQSDENTTDRCAEMGSGQFSWPYLNRDNRTVQMVSVPVDAVLSIPMFLRTYLLGRFMVLHSKQFQDAATRSIAGLNRISVDFFFVLRTRMLENPLQSLIVFSAIYWVCLGWMLTQCERYNGMYDGHPAGTSPRNSSSEWIPQHTYLNSIWLIMVTFMSIGYGDIVPNTYCGRALAVTTGLVGCAASSALVAVIARKLELTKAEKHVNNFMSDSKLSTQRKNAAASVLQETWFIHKYRTAKHRDNMKVRTHQRRFLKAINGFRQVKWDQRRLAEQGNALIDVGQVQLELQESVRDMQRRQDEMISQIVLLTENIICLQHCIMSADLQHPVSTNQRFRMEAEELEEDDENVFSEPEQEQQPLIREDSVVFL